MLNKTLLKPYNIITIKFYTFDTLHYKLFSI